MEGTGAKPQILIGTSGWSYPHWRGVFYPPKLPSRDYLSFYAQHFSTVEVNSPFYRLPREDTLKRWEAVTPEGFHFALKANRSITHILRLRDCADPLGRFLQLARCLASKLGPVLFQLPPSLHRDEVLLAAFLELLPWDVRVAVEFRHRSWYDESTERLLAARGVAMCIHDLHGCEAPILTTAPFVYVRLHGPQHAYTGSYTDQQLSAWAEMILNWTNEGRDVYVYFNNDIGGHAVANALTLCDLVKAGCAPLTQGKERDGPPADLPNPTTGC